MGLSAGTDRDYQFEIQIIKTELVELDRIVAL
jgi:hypothetical protein